MPDREEGMAKKDSMAAPKPKPMEVRLDEPEPETLRAIGAADPSAPLTASH
jgi:hypothetical protein